MKFVKLLGILGVALMLTGCESDEVDRLEDRMDNLEDKIDALLEQNGVNSGTNTGTSGNTDTVINDGEGETTVDTSSIEETISGYESDADALADSISNLSTPASRSDAIDLYWEWKAQLEELENTVDRYEDELERMYRNNTLSYSDFRTFDRRLEDIDNTLDRAEDDLEYITRYDD